MINGLKEMISATRAGRPATRENIPCVTVQCLYRAAAWLSPLDRPALRGVLLAMLDAAREQGHFIGGIDLYLLDDAEIACANARHLGASGPTNIISFPSDGSMNGILLLSLDSFARECLLYGQDPVAHLLRLLAHGVGHLAGFEHGPRMDRLCAACLANAENAVQQG